MENDSFSSRTSKVVEAITTKLTDIRYKNQPKQYGLKGD